jgi:hypothetical protein
MNKFYLFVFISLFNLNAHAQKYKLMMHDNSINFYDVCHEAEAYFDAKEKTESIDSNTEEEGSDYTKFEMWKALNEPYYYPSGNRMVDHNIAIKKYQELKAEQANNSQRLFMTGGWKNLGPDSLYTITGHYAAGLGRVECPIKII